MGSSGNAEYMGMLLDDRTITDHRSPINNHRSPVYVLSTETIVRSPIVDQKNIDRRSIKSSVYVPSTETVVRSRLPITDQGGEHALVCVNGDTGVLSLLERFLDALDIGGTGADVWVVLINVALDQVLLTELLGSVVSSCDKGPGVVTHVDDSASERVHTHLHVVSHLIRTHFEGKCDHEGSGGDGLTSELLPSDFVHGNSGASAFISDA